jgi:hypothetical protein
MLGDGDKGIEIVYGEEKIFCSGPTRAAKAEQKSLLPLSFVPIHISFNRQQKPPLSSLSGFEQETAPRASCDLRNTLNSRYCHDKLFGFESRYASKIINRRHKHGNGQHKKYTTKILTEENPPNFYNIKWPLSYYVTPFKTLNFWPFLQR